MSKPKTNFNKNILLKYNKLNNGNNINSWNKKFNTSIRCWLEINWL